MTRQAIHKSARRKEGWKGLSLFLSPGEYEQLNLLAKQMQCSKAEAIRRMLTLSVERDVR